jgi:hypothetical protein
VNLMGSIVCPICGGSCVEEVHNGYVVHTLCTTCRLFEFRYSHDKATHRHRIGNVTYLLIESLPDEEYDRIQDDINGAILAAQKEYWKEHEIQEKVGRGKMDGNK